MRFLDQSEAVIQDAKVIVANHETGAQRSANSDSAGLYLVADLPPGTYEVRAGAKGFRTLVQSWSRCGLDSVQESDLRLPLGVVQQVVEASDRIPALDYDNHGIGSVVSRFQIENLPLNGLTSSFSWPSLNPALRRRRRPASSLGNSMSPF